MVNLDVISAEELKKNCENFNAMYGLSLEINYTFKERFAKILKQNPQISAAEFAERTGYNVKRFYRMKNGEIPSMETFVSFCVAFQIDIQNASEMLKSFGVSFNPTDKVHTAYCYLISECRGKSLYECNEILKDLGVSPLLGDLE